MHRSSIDLPVAIRQSTTALLQARLVDAVDLYTHAKQAHWNVKGVAFIALHELFDRVAGLIADQADELAERIVALGGYARGSARAVAAGTSLPEYPNDASAAEQHLDALTSRLAAFGRSVRADIDRAAALGDAGTADLFTGMSRAIDKQLWLVEAHSTDA